MPVEFALRPRIRLREAPAPAARARARLPKFALPALAYWLVIGGLVYEFVQHHDGSAPPAETDAALAAMPPSPAPAVRQWWRPLPARPTPEAPSALGAPEATAALEPATPLISEARVPEPETEGLSPEPALSEPPPREPAPIAEPPIASDAAPGRTRQRSRARSPLSQPFATPAPTPTFAPTRVPEPAPTVAVSPPLVPPSPAPDTSHPSYAGGLPSCESAIESASQDIDFSGGNRAADLPTQAIAAVLENGAWLASCGLPEHTAVDVCVAIKGGRVVGASVTTRPADTSLNACVRRRASSLQFPYSPHLDVARTRF